QRTKNDLIKMTLRQSNVPIRSSQGEFLLSREIGDLARDFNAGAVLLSTYSVTPDAVYVQVQLVNADTHAIVGTTLYELPNGPRTRALLKNQESVATSRYR
ncbi:MAG: FlgO family outer membrane protein, partial [Planctomycetota bacterium]|nr:FlgO family outer membrane protein [Planctomycetota bacterium]